MNKELFKILNNTPKEKDITVVLFISGGKDSSYALNIISEHMNDCSKIMAVTMDNGFLSNGARKNIELFKKKGIQHEYFSINKEILFKFYQNLVKKGTKNPRSVCVGCNILSAKMEYVALNKYQPTYFITGNSSMELETFNSWLKRANIQPTGSGNHEFEQKHGFWEYNNRILLEFKDDVPDVYEALSVPEPKIEDYTSSISQLNVFKYVPYDVKIMFDTLKKIGWKYPKDVIGTESDCIFTQAITLAYVKNHGEEAYKNVVNKLVKEDKIPSETGEKAIAGLEVLDTKMGNALLASVNYPPKEDAKTSIVLTNAVNDLLPIR